MFNQYTVGEIVVLNQGFFDFPKKEANRINVVCSEFKHEI